MIQNKITPKGLWAQQQISSHDVDYGFWDKKREFLEGFSRMCQSYVFTVDVFEGRYDFVSSNFSDHLGFHPAWIKTIRKQGDILEERIHPDDRGQLTDFQVEHGQFIYSLDPEYRNDYQQNFQFRMLNGRQQYLNVISRHRVLQTDKQGKAWIIMGIMDVSPDQSFTQRVKRTVVNRRTGEICTLHPTLAEKSLTHREKEILLLIQQGFLSKEIADQLHISIYTVHNHRKNILAKLEVDNVMEAINKVNASGIFY